MEPCTLHISNLVLRRKRPMIEFLEQFPRIEKSHADIAGRPKSNGPFQSAATEPYCSTLYAENNVFFLIYRSRPFTHPSRFYIPCKNLLTGSMKYGWVSKRSTQVKEGSNHWWRVAISKEGRFNELVPRLLFFSIPPWDNDTRARGELKLFSKTRGYL